VLIPVLLSLVATSVPGGSDVWPGFRGDGSSRTRARNLPVHWSPTESLAWRVETPGYGQSAPVAWKGRVYVTSVEGDEKETLHVLCYAADDGRKLWQKTLAATQKGKNSPATSRAAPTPVVDQAGVYAFFESGDLIALTHDGRVRWQRSLAKQFGELKNNHGLGGSPAQTERAVLVLVDHQGPCYLLAVNKADGEDLWKAGRTPRSSWTSPIVVSAHGEPAVLVSSGGAVTAYDATSGQRLWELGGLTGNTVPSATASGDLVVIGAGDSVRKPDPAGAARSNCCLRLTADGKPGYEVVWRAKRVIAGTASPLVHAGHVYLTDKAGIVHCLDLTTGEARYAERLENQQWATPVGAGGHVYFFGKDGVTTVLKTGPSFEKVAANRLWTAEDFTDRKAAARKVAAATQPKPPEGKGPGGGPPLPKSEADAARDSAVGDVVYGVAAVDGAFFVRTGTELFCVRSRK
jgi:outer membrane protein assembly factor BamB